MIEWSDDDETPVAPSLSTQAPPRSTRMEEQSRESIEVPGQQAREFPEQQMTEVPGQQAREFPEQQVEVNPKRRADEAPE